MATTQGAYHVHKTIVGEQLVQGCYAVTWVGFISAIFQMQGTKLTTEPPHPR